MNKPIRIGTRASDLAQWQAKTVQKKLEDQGYQTELVPVKSEGDRNLEQPLYEMGITGIFTKALDIALLSDKIDIAVHSMKDVPTLLPKGVVQAAVLKRETSSDLLVHKGLDFLNGEGTIATGSLRRKAQWLNRYPKHKVVNLRGNVNSRLKKLEENDWNAAIFAAAGLKRVELTPENSISLDWMLPAPAQGAMLVVTKEENSFCKTALQALNNKEATLCTHIEREFLRVLEGGCTAPIGALATIENETVHFKGGLFSLDGKQQFIEETTFPVEDYKTAGEKAAKSILNRGGKELMKKIKEKIN